MNDSLRAKFTASGQGHVFAFWDELSPADQANLAAQAASIDQNELQHLVDVHIKGGSHAQNWDDIKPASFVPLPVTDADKAVWAEARRLGEEAIKAGRVAAFTPAGGQGSRLGYAGPKGTFCVTPVANHTLFQVFAEKIVAMSRRYGVQIPWYIMTSEENHETTENFFIEHKYFGMAPENLKLFKQGCMPATDLTGKILMAGKGQIVLAPDGHGGSFRALVRSGSIEDMKARGIDIVSFFQVDNPLVRCIHPEFIGFHVKSGSEFSNKACMKAYTSEKVGVFVERNGRTELVEYSDLPADLMNATSPDGTILFRAGSVGIHAIARDLIQKVGSGLDPNCQMPFHRATKKIPTVGADGSTVFPAEPNGVKFEMFGFDALPFANKTLVMETSRKDEFSPVKNAEGVDSPATSRADQLRMFARWVRASGQSLAVDDTGLPEFEFEISPLFADSEEAYLQRAKEAVIAPGAVLTDK